MQTLKKISKKKNHEFSSLGIFISFFLCIEEPAYIRDITFAKPYLSLEIQNKLKTLGPSPSTHFNCQLTTSTEGYMTHVKTRILNPCRQTPTYSRALLKTGLCCKVVTRQHGDIIISTYLPSLAAQLLIM